MRILRLIHGEQPYYARWVDEMTARLWTGAPWLGGIETDRLVPLAGKPLLAPVEPSKIVCVGRNYRAHAKELGNEVPSEPLLFLKPPSALVGHDAEIVLPADSARVEHEAELGVVIGAPLRHATATDALAGIFGLTAVNDVTARDLQKKDVQFTRAKGFDTFCPCGPWIVTGLSPLDLGVSLRVNGTTRQDGRTRDMVFPVAELIAAMSRVMTLLPGDLISTGTPEGVGPLAKGDVVELEVEGVGVLRSRVRAPGGATTVE